MGDSPEEVEGGTGGGATVIVDSGGAPAWCTSAEVDAKLLALDTKIRADFDQRFTGVHDRISAAEQTAYQAQDAADSAQDTAEVAAVLAETALDEVEGDGEPEGGGGGDGAKGDEDDGAPKAPEKKSAQEAKPEEDSGKKPWRERLFPNG